MLWLVRHGIAEKIESWCESRTQSISIMTDTSSVKNNLTPKKKKKLKYRPAYVYPSFSREHQSYPYNVTKQESEGACHLQICYAHMTLNECYHRIGPAGASQGMCPPRHSLRPSIYLPGTTRPRTCVAVQRERGRGVEGIGGECLVRRAFVLRN